METKGREKKERIASGNISLKIFYKWFFQNWHGHISSWYLTTDRNQIPYAMTTGLMWQLSFQALTPITALWTYLLWVLDYESETRGENGLSAMQNEREDLPSSVQLPAFHLRIEPWSGIVHCLQHGHPTKAKRKTFGTHRFRTVLQAWI